MYSLSVVITCSDAGQAVLYCLQSVLGQSLVPSEVIVVDDSPVGGAREAVAAFGRRGVRCCRVDVRNELLAAAMGVRQCTGEIVCCLSADDRLDPNYFENGMREFALAEVGIVYARVAHLPAAAAREPFGGAGPADVSGELLDHAALVRRSALMAAGALREGKIFGTMQGWCDWEKLVAAGYRALAQEGVCYTPHAAPGVFAGSLSGQQAELILEEHFDEEFYLRVNVDVRDAVSRGVYRSGHEHYTLFGKGERRSARLKQS